MSRGSWTASGGATTRIGLVLASCTVINAAVIVWTVLLWSGQSFEDQGALHAAFPWLLDGCFNATITGVVWPFLASVSATGITFAVEPDNRRAAVWRIIVRTIGVAAAIIALSPWLIGLPAVCTY